MVELCFQWAGERPVPAANTPADANYRQHAIAANCCAYVYLQHAALVWCRGGSIGCGENAIAVMMRWRIAHVYVYGSIGRFAVWRDYAARSREVLVPRVLEAERHQGQPSLNDAPFAQERKGITRR